MSVLDWSVQRVLARPLFYNTFQRAVGVETQRATIVRQYLALQPGARVLDIGCGTADILVHFPPLEFSYDGVDYNPRYIEFARQRWSSNPSCRFHLVTVDRSLPDNPLLGEGAFDVVMAIGVLHHLDDSSAAGLIRTAHRALKSGGRFVTMDPCRFPAMNWPQRWIVDHDRGKFIRDEAGYRALFQRAFEPAQITTEVRANIVKVPGKSVYAVCIR